MPPLPTLDNASLADAQAAFLGAVEPLGHTTVQLMSAQGYALALPVSAPIALPSFDNSAMDGFALRSADVARATPAWPVRLAIVGEAAAGHAFRGTLRAGQTARVMTGAPLPAGADAVLPNEEAIVAAESLQVMAAVRADRHVRRAGEDVAVGQLVLESAVTLGPAELALLAALGIASVRVVRRPRVAVITTGDELRLPGLPLGESGIYNANLVALCAQLREAGAEPVPLPAVADQPAAIDAALTVALQADALVTSAGVCDGDHDHMRESLGRRGQFSGGCLRLRPARHVGLGLIDAKPVFALPGNPAASLIAFELLVRPAILRLGGHRSSRRPTVQATMVEPIQSTRGVTQAIWVRLDCSDDGYCVRPAGQQGAGMLGPAARAHGLLLVPETVEHITAGTVVPVQMLTGSAPDER
ncbi:MAG TPA: gephyrin-like molybdotransferase Glp [Chloroflexota bacterium]